MAHLFIFGLGYSAKRIRTAMEALGWRVTATGSDGELDFADQVGVRAALATASHALSSVPPGDAGDPVLDRYGDALGHGWLGYLSSTGVYGDAAGRAHPPAQCLRRRANALRRIAEAEDEQMRHARVLRVGRANETT